MKKVFLCLNLGLVLASCGADTNTSVVNEEPLFKPATVTTEVISAPKIGREFTIDRSLDNIRVISSASCTILRDHLGGRFQSCDLQYFIRSNSKIERYSLSFDRDVQRYAKMTRFEQTLETEDTFENEWNQVTVQAPKSHIRINKLQRVVDDLHFQDTLRCRTTSLYKTILNLTPEARGHLAVFDYPSDLLYRLSKKFMPYLEIEWLSGKYLGLGLVNYEHFHTVHAENIAIELKRTSFEWDHFYGGFEKDIVIHGRRPYALSGYLIYRHRCDSNYGYDDFLGAYNEAADKEASYYVEKDIKDGKFNLEYILNSSDQFSDNDLDRAVESIKNLKVIEVKK